MIDFTWRAHPALRFALALAVGILAAREGCVLPEHALALLAFAALAGAWALRHRGDEAHPSTDDGDLRSGGLFGEPRSITLPAHRKRAGATREAVARAVAPIALLLVIVSTGALLGLVAAASTPEVPEAIAIDRAEIVGAITEAPRLRNGGLELVVACDSIILRSSIARVGARALVRIDDSTLGAASSLAEGDRLSVLGDLRAPRQALLPGELDERAYLRSRDITLLLDVDDAGQAARITSGADIATHRAIAWVRGAMGYFAREHVGGEEGEIVEALLSGDRDGIDRATKEAFAATGTLHVLAVSGLHVAVIALGLSVLTSWVPDRRWQFLLFAMVLGFYTLVTGAGPSIVRAWCMATCFMLARLVGRRTSALNVLAVSAMLLLLVRPDDLYDIGFQLSYGAVAGIILFHRHIVESAHERWPTLRNRAWLDRPMRALSMTLAAQALSMPLLMMHFGAVPALGLLLNLPVVPLTSLAMASSAVGLLAMPAPPLAAAMGASAFVATRLAVAIVEWGAALPFTSLTVRLMPPALALAAIIGLVWAAAAPRLRVVVVRIVLVVCAIATCTLVPRRDSTLVAGAHPRAYLVPSGGGLLVATLVDDTLRAIVLADSHGGRRRVGVLARNTGAGQTELVDVDALPGVDATHRQSQPSGSDRIEHRQGARPRQPIESTDADSEYRRADRPRLRAIARLPILVEDSHAPVRCAALEGVATLVVGLRWRPGTMLVLEYNGRWNPLAWH